MRAGYRDKGLVASIALILTAGCSDRAQTTMPQQPQEYAVYDAVLLAMFLDPAWNESYKAIRRSEIKQFAIVQHTSLGEPPVLAAYSPGIDSTLKKLAPVPEGLFDRLLKENEVSVDLDDHFTVQFPVTLVEEDVVRKLSDDLDHGGWDAYWVRYPQSQGLLVFSRVVFDHDGRTALVYAANGLASMNAAGHLILLERLDGIWSVARTSLLWVS